MPSDCNRLIMINACNHTQTGFNEIYTNYIKSIQRQSKHKSNILIEAFLKRRD